MRRFDRTFSLTNRLRSEGTDHLLAAGRAVGVRRFVAQSYGGWPYARAGGPVKDEDDPLDAEHLHYTHEDDGAATGATTGDTGQDDGVSLTKGDQR